ncbi:hypothetical protein A2761_00660 [Candidatus Kaiserbacteria bacterium RIFCSPHIGHO2_01_FULL_51_33]|uniref:phenylalanine--tRNA ligase n=1 Tax=Candidatus Kaiserbacteria bacterium RIFCSPLOWO2_01_FULL_51_21 TaxID=1798508 RepID=A0A1F6ED18_9BACT|nr:MAG: hypothetical protein A2761_00660 [Candidatus Kaiserbacteria bacterium RIFCSPHIGHO2_01_FULL_51_33]OGG71536.1 MAG: hypothetical protein A3A35_03025 [Candidatus Kaiserbacteria bacterium RIFCSPLOWO2_01_FULL_51_21]
MKISRSWLQSFFDAELPSVEKLAETLTFHAFEIESFEQARGDEVLDVKITPNRGHDCLSHRGIAKELSVILNVPLSRDPLASHPPLTPDSNVLTVSVENRELCPAYAAAIVENIAVGPSPGWLKERLESIGQRSINNVVDATNFMMFELGQPLHAFDMGKLADKDGMYEIAVRNAKAGEKLLSLDGKEYKLSPETLCIVDAIASVPIGIAGVKGGKSAEITKDTHDIIIESANFNAAAIRRTAQALKLRTDASVLFEHELSPEITGYGLTAAVELIVKVAGGVVEGFFDIYAEPEERKITLFASDANKILGTELTVNEIEQVLKQFAFVYEREGERFTVTSPFERLDLRIKEDLVEEIGRIVGFDKVPVTELPPFSRKAEVNKRFYWGEQIRQELIVKGYSEVITSVFTEKGEREVLNKADSVKPYLRATLLENLTAALAKNLHMKESLGLQEIKLFEIGTVWGKSEESTVVGTISEKEGPVEVLLEEWPGLSDTPSLYEKVPPSPTTHYEPLSPYPFIVRDVAIWVSVQTKEEEVHELVKEEAGRLLSKSWRFDRFEKEGKVSLAYRLVFQSFERTLTDEEVNNIMEKISAALLKRGYTVR